MQKLDALRAKTATKFFVCAFALIGAYQPAMAEDAVQNFSNKTRAYSMQKLDPLRIEIEKIDAEIIQKIAARMAIVKQIGQTKKEAGIAVLDPTRETQLLQKYQSLAQENQLDPLFIQHLFEMIFSYSRNLQ